MNNATLFDPLTGEKRVVEGGSQAAQKAFGKGFELETPTNRYSPESALRKATNQFADFQYGLPAFREEVKSQLKGRIPHLRQSFTDLQEKFGDKESSDYIENPQVRDQIINNILSSGKTTLAGLLDRAQAQFGLGQGRAQTQLGLAQQAYQQKQDDENALIDRAFSAGGLSGGRLDPQTEQLLNEKGLLNLWQGSSTVSREGTPLEQRQAAPSYSSPSLPNLKRSSVFGPSGNQIGFNLYNPQSGGSTFTNMYGDQSLNLPEGSRVGGINYDLFRTPDNPDPSVDPYSNQSLADEVEEYNKNKEEDNKNKGV